MGRLSYVLAEFFLKTQPGAKRFTRLVPAGAGTPNRRHSPTGSPKHYNCQWRDFPRRHRLAKQLELFPTDEGAAESDRASTFADNLSQPVHRWFRYSAGFSAPWVEQLIQREKAKGRRRVLDPFAGSGTSLLAAECCDIDAIGIEAHPFVARIAQAKLCWRENQIGRAHV